MIFFDLRNNFKDTSTVILDSNVQDTFVDDYKDFSVLYDKNLNIKQVNFFNFDILTFNKNIVLREENTNKLKSLLASTNKRYILNSKKLIAYGKIISRTTHPKSKNLFVLDVDFNGFRKQIITNTDFTLENKYFLFFLSGSITANNDRISEGTILDAKSAGMLASAYSLGLQKENNLLFNQKFNDYLNQQNVIDAFWQSQDIYSLLGNFEKE
ncbi:TyrS-associated PheT N-terminal domain-related protein TapR [Mycoplasmopsis columbinasalis]|uniref:Phenylalanyl-tRNA synthetase subunit beta n=1 Tax=Mycoplasmopsis columbinasalis TaxID=114880 RepID=A0A449BAB2_9BACT|nr:tRNA-binding protein [Mycoplasmopsis columbinasalis]VEU78118.1 phenylalanyl-tRNA synthetase subunit beta [Mycoplasmopsis columbinasalis]